MKAPLCPPTRCYPSSCEPIHVCSREEWQRLHALGVGCGMSPSRLIQNRFAKLFALLTGLATSVVGTSVAAAADDVYPGKQIRLIVSSAPGGVYDTFGRLIARFLPAHL